jgi:hypothetical protein
VSSKIATNSERHVMGSRMQTTSGKQRTTSDVQRAAGVKRLCVATAGCEQSGLQASNNEATAGQRPMSGGVSGSARPGVSNKPMVPTAPSPTTHHQPDPLRRHIGRPLGCLVFRLGR